MASLQARHTRKCSLGRPWTAFRTDDGPHDAEGSIVGCTCQPMYYTVGWADGKAVRERVGRNRKTAKQAIKPVDAAELRGELEVIKNIRFDKWSEKWLRSLKKVKPSTLTSYRATMRRGCEVFGSKQVRRLTLSDVTRFLEHVEKVKGAQASPDRPTTSSTQSKHLRALSACLASATAHGYAAKNVATQLPDNETPRRRKSKAPYFTDEELPRLFAELRHTGGYRVLCLLALKTGMRLGELSALSWGDVRMAENEIWVHRGFTEGNLDTPKSGKDRTIAVTDEVVDLLGEWWGELGNPADDTLVLPGDTKTGFINPQVVLRRELYPAMERAGIPRGDRNGEKRVFHSFRHTYARVALENATPMAVLSEHLGHSSTLITASTYAHISAKASRQQAQALQGAFPV